MREAIGDGDTNVVVRMMLHKIQVISFVFASPAAVHIRSTSFHL